MKKFKKEHLIILLLSTALIVCIVFLYLEERISYSGDDKKLLYFKKRIPDSTARANISNYLDQLSIRKKSRGVWYDTSDVMTYMRDSFPSITEQIPLQKDCKWVLGFYFMRKQDVDGNGKSKLDFYVVPTMYNYITGEVYDFGDPKYFAYYQTRRPNSKLAIDDSSAFDAGHLWP